MPTTENGRKLVSDWLKREHITVQGLANFYGMSRQEASNYINGTKVNPKANNFILKVIEDFKIK